MNTVVDWRAFQINRPDSYGIQHKFEALCRQLFINDIIGDSSVNSYLHSNPNNPGLESEPIYDKRSEKRLGYQVKFFENTPNYSQIKESIKKIIKYYSGQVDVVYLFCNKSLTSSSYADCIQLLKESSIELISITDEHILDIARKYPYLAEYYFGCYWLTNDWFDMRLHQSLDTLGNRYNRLFNIDTTSSRLISLFANDQKAADALNKKKQHLLNRIDSYRYISKADHAFLLKLRSAVCSLPDVTPSTIVDSISWFDQIKANIADARAELEQRLESISRKLDELLLIHHQDKASSSSAKIFYLRKDLELYNDLINLVNDLSLNNQTIEAITKKILIVRGTAGAGKTQLFAHATKQLNDEGVTPIFLLGEKYLSDTQIKKQIIDGLEITCTFDDLVQLLNMIGTEKKRPITIFIDALNETWNHRLWKNDLCSMIQCVEKANYVKLAISYRIEYEDIIIPDVVKSEENIFRIDHNGFATDGPQAIREFITSSGISFSPVEYFNHNLTNPLFLSLYCRTYDGSEIDLQELYNRIIKNANDSVMRMTSLSHQHLFAGDSNVISRFVNEFAALTVESNRRPIELDEIKQLHFWEENGLCMQSIVNALVNEGLLNRFSIQDKEYVQFSYDQMNDYYCARYLVQSHTSFESLLEYIDKYVLEISSGSFCTEKMGLFLNMAALMETKFDKDVLDLSDGIHEDEYRQMLIDHYLDSYKWRSRDSVSSSRVMRLFDKYQFSTTTVWEVLILNCIKENHALNADLLHNFLKPMSITYRDRVWTTYINHLMRDDYVVQLQEFLFAEEAPVKMTNEQIRLLLILQAWLLTSTNRYIRDITSKAMIELMKDNFWSCHELLTLFNDVNDPYVIQRLYGIIWGVCCKSSSKSREQYCVLAEEVYHNIFAQEYVYPDVLLRDYARLIIDRFIWENSDYVGVIDIDKTKPPYHSEELPLEIEYPNSEEKYKKESYDLVQSMRFEGMGMYGDFGRYVFQRALKYFDVDDKHQAIHEYAMHYIFNDIGYSKEFFGNYDQRLEYNQVSRAENAKLERIGKKYQWIAFYNIMARISDHYLLVEGYGDDSIKKPFSGPWEPYIRDFDPTLNHHFLHDPKALPIDTIEKHYVDANTLNQTLYSTNTFSSRKWLLADSSFYTEQPDTLVANTKEATWVTLEKIEHTDSSNLDICRLYDWCRISGYFVTSDLLNTILATPPNHFYINELTYPREEYVLFNREYPWSIASQCMVQDNVCNIDVHLGKETITETIDDSGYLSELLSLYNGDEDEASPHAQTYTRDIRDTIGKGIRSSLSMRWEEEYDASKGEVHTHYVPYADVLLKMGLSQGKYEFSYNDQNNVLAAYETTRDSAYSALVIRKDILDEYLQRNGQCLVWFMQGCREIHNVDRTIAETSERIAVWYYTDGKVVGKLSKPMSEETN